MHVFLQAYLIHRPALEQGVVRVNSPRDRIEGVHLPRKPHEVGSDEAEDGDHGRAAVAELALRTRRRRD